MRPLGGASLSGPRLRSDRRGAEQTFQALPAVLITIVVVGMVFGVLGAVDGSARERASEQRALLQADLFLAAIPREAALAAPGGAVSWAGARAIAAGGVGLSFVPPRACVATVLDTQSGSELFLLGSQDTLAPGCTISSVPVPLLLENGTFVPGLLRAGVFPS